VSCNERLNHYSNTGLYIDVENPVSSMKSGIVRQAGFVCAGCGISEWNLCCLWEGFISAPWTLPSYGQLPFHF